MQVTERKYFFDKLLSVVQQHITSDYVLLGVPNHMNLGDSLIWQAEKDLFKNIPYKNIATYFWGVPSGKINVPKGSTIIFTGGGSWDDIWNTINYIEAIISAFNDYKIFFMPNSVWYNNKERVKKTIGILSKHTGEIILCSREQQSYDFATKEFPMAKNYLVPDVVLGWDAQSYMKEHSIALKASNKTLFLSRNDKEKISIKQEIKADKISDWPTFNVPSYVNKNVSCKEWESKILPKLIRESIEFLVGYEIVYSDRMHGAILSWLLGKQTVLINNSYGKSKSLYDTWLKECDGIKMMV